MSTWNAYIKGFKSFLQLEKSLSRNSVEAYLHDVEKLQQFLIYSKQEQSIEQIDLTTLQGFLKWIHELGMTPTSQARIISGLKSYFKYLVLEDVIKKNPTELLEAPKTSRKLPDTLSIEELELLFNAIDLTHAEGTRNKAILETMYSCGLRVSELTELKISNIYTDVEFIRVAPTNTFRSPESWKYLLNYRTINFRQFVIEADL
jgi:integrase/recombinase XerD